MVLTKELIFWPVIAHMALVVIVYLRLSGVKVRAYREKRADAKRVALHHDAWPDDVLKVSNNLKNQFEAPVLFYALVFMTWAAGAVDVVSLSLASIFVLSRYLHSYVHMTSNRVPLRRRIFVFGVVVLIAMIANVARVLV